MNWWKTLVQLKGCALKTLGRGEPFTIVAVTDQSIVVRPHSTDKDRRVTRDEIESAFGELQQRGEMPFIDIRKHKHSEANPAYVAALLATLPGVTTSTSPIRLRFKRK